MNALNQALVSVVDNDAYLSAPTTGKLVGKLHHSVAPAGTPLPYAVYEKRPSPRHVYTLGGIAWRRLRYRLKVYAQDTTSQDGSELANDILERLNAILIPANLVVSGWKVGMCRMEGLEEEYSERLGNDTLFYATAMWSIDLTPSA
jgi:hypothetical protein